MTAPIGRGTLPSSTAHQIPATPRLPLSPRPRWPPPTNCPQRAARNYRSRCESAMKPILLLCLCGLAYAAEGSQDPKAEEARELKACAQMVLDGFRKIPDARAQRFQGKV